MSDREIRFRLGVNWDSDEEIKHQFEFLLNGTLVVIEITHEEFLKFLWDYGEPFADEDNWKEAEEMFSKKEVTP